MCELKPDIPVTKYANQYLSNYNTNNFHVINCVDPRGVTGFASGTPTTFESSLEKRLDVADREEYVTMYM